jgi:hypothetical protein
MAKKSEWVALLSFVDESAGMFYEDGGVYDHEPRSKAHRDGRRLEPGEHLAACPRCGHRFAQTEDGTAEEHRDLHFNGDDAIPSICRNFPVAERRAAIGAVRAKKTTRSSRRKL